jgi:hypothetical protein
LLKRIAAVVALAVASTLAGGSALATTVTNFTGPSLHGATGSLAITDLGAGSYTVVWSINLDTFDDADAIATGHTLLTHVAFKAFSSIDNVALDDPTVGALNYPSNINGSCAASSPAGFVCVTLANPVLATAGGTFDVTFDVTGGVLAKDEYSFRGKFGPRTGWVISESAPPGSEIPEPSAAIVFGSGLLLVGARLRRR